MKDSVRREGGSACEPPAYLPVHGIKLQSACVLAFGGAELGREMVCNAC